MNTVYYVHPSNGHFTTVLSQAILDTAVTTALQGVRLLKDPRGDDAPPFTPETPAVQKMIKANIGAVIGWAWLQASGQDMVREKRATIQEGKLIALTREHLDQIIAATLDEPERKLSAYLLLGGLLQADLGRAKALKDPEHPEINYPEMSQALPFSVFDWHQVRQNLDPVHNWFDYGRTAEDASPDCVEETARAARRVLPLLAQRVLETTSDHITSLLDRTSLGMPDITAGPLNELIYIAEVFARFNPGAVPFPALDTFIEKFDWSTAQSYDVPAEYLDYQINVLRHTLEPLLHARTLAVTSTDIAEILDRTCRDEEGQRRKAYNELAYLAEVFTRHNPTGTPFPGLQTVINQIKWNITPKGDGPLPLGGNEKAQGVFDAVARVAPMLMALSETSTCQRPSGTPNVARRGPGPTEAALG